MKNILACRFVTWKVFFSILQDRTGFTIFLLAITFIFSSFFIVGDFFELHTYFGGKLGYTELSNLPGGMGGEGSFPSCGGVSFSSITIHTFFMHFTFNTLKKNVVYYFFQADYSGTRFICHINRRVKTVFDHI